MLMLMLMLRFRPRAIEIEYQFIVRAECSISDCFGIWRKKSPRLNKGCMQSPHNFWQVFSPSNPVSFFYIFFFLSSSVSISFIDRVGKCRCIAVVVPVVSFCSCKVCRSYKFETLSIHWIMLSAYLSLQILNYTNTNANTFQMCYFYHFEMVAYHFNLKHIIKQKFFFFRFLQFQ